MRQEKDDIIKNNERFWLEMTKSGTLTYCHEMLKLSPEFQKKCSSDTDYYAHLKSIDGPILKYVDLLNEHSRSDKWDKLTPNDTPFPSDIHGYIHEYNGDSGWFQPKHLMCKLAVLRDDENSINYEFLIEYDILSPDVEIYFGVKAVSDNYESTDEFKNTVIEDWRKVSSDKYKQCAHRLKLTNNVNHGTFWPFWCRMNIDSKEGLLDVISIIKDFYRDYKKVLRLHDIDTFKPKFIELKAVVAKSLQSKEDYDNLIAKIAEDYDNEVSSRFEKLLQYCTDKNIIALDRNSMKYHCLGPTVKMICILKRFFDLPQNVYKEEKGPKKRTPWEYIKKVVLDKDKRVINKANWQKMPEDMHPHWVRAGVLIQEIFPNLKQPDSQ